MPKSFSLEEAYAKPVESPVKKSFSLEEAYGEEPKQDNAIQRGFKSMASSSVSTSKLATKDYEGIADEQLEMAKYREANPGNKAGNDMMEGWQAGDGEEKDTFMGGVRGASHVVADKFRKAEGFIPKARVVADTAGGALSILGEQVPNMIPGLVGMGAGALGGTAGGAAVAGPIGGAVGGIAGSVAGAGVGNALVEGGEMIQHDLQKAGIAPGDRDATKAYLEQHGDTILGQAGVKGTIIGAIDRATLGAGHYLLTDPAKQAMNRALTQLGVDTADSAAVAAAKVGQREAIGRLIAGDAVYQSSKTGVGNVARNTGAFALEPAGEFAGEYIGTGVARGEWDAKNAGLEAIMSLGQSGLMYGGQKAVQALQKPFEQNGQQTPPPAPQPTPEDQTPPTTEPALELAPIDAGQPGTELSSPVVDQVAPLSADLGINPAAGSLSEAAALAVDTGAAPVAAELQASRDAQSAAATDNTDLAPTLTAAADVAAPVTRQAFDTAIAAGDLATANTIGSELYRQANEIERVEITGKINALKNAPPAATTQDPSQVGSTTTEAITQPAYTSDTFRGVWNTLPSSDHAAIARTAGINEQGVSGNDWLRVSPRDRQQLVDAMNTGVELQDSALAAQWDALTPDLRAEHLASSGMFANPNSVAAKAFAKNRNWDSIPTTDKDKLAAVFTQQAAPVVQPDISAQPANYQSDIESINSNSSPVVPAKIQLTRTGNNYTVDAQNAPVIAAELGDTVEAGKTYSYPVDKHKALAEALQGKVELLTPKVTQPISRFNEIELTGNLANDIQRLKLTPALIRDLSGEGQKAGGSILGSSNKRGQGDLGNLMDRLNNAGVGYNYQDQDVLANDLMIALRGEEVLSPDRRVDKAEKEIEQREIDALIADAAEIGITVERKRGETSKQLFDRIDAMKQAEAASTTPEADAAVEALAPMLSADDKAAIIATPEQAVDSLTNQDGIWFNEFLQEWQDSKGNPVQETQNERNTAETSQSNTEQVPEGTAEANPVARSNAKTDIFGEDTTTKQAIHDRKLDKDAKRSGGDNPVGASELVLTGANDPLSEGMANGQADMLDALDAAQEDATPPKTTEQPGSKTGSQISTEALADIGLYREYGDRHQYRMASRDGTVSGSWFTSNSKDGAIEMATKAYNAMPENSRLTRAQRDEKANAEYDAISEQRYGGMTIQELKNTLEKMVGEIADLHKAGKREFNGNGGRRTGAAVSNEGARNVAEEKMRVERYLKSREDVVQKDAANQNQIKNQPADSATNTAETANAGAVQPKKATKQTKPTMPAINEAASPEVEGEWLSDSEQREQAQQDYNAKIAASGLVRQVRLNSAVEMIPFDAAEHRKIAETLEKREMLGLSVDQELDLYEKQAVLADKLAKIGWSNDQIAANDLNMTVKVFKEQVKGGYVGKNYGLDIERLARARYKAPTDAGQSRKADVSGEKKLSAAERKQYATDFMLEPVMIMEAMIERGDIDVLFKAAGLKNADSFGDLSLEQQANAYADAIEKGHSPVAITEDYNTKVMRLEHEAIVRRLQEEVEVMQANGKPFKTSSSAGKFQATYALEDTHEITNVEGGFALKRLPPARRPSELKRIAENQANDPETQRQEAAFAKAKTIGDAANPIVEKYGYGRIDIDTFERSLNDLSKGQSINQDTPLDAVFDRLTTDKSKAKQRVTREQVRKRDDSDAILNIHENFKTIVADLKAASKLTVINC